MRARIEQVMQKQFSVFQADTELRTVLQKFVPGDVGCLPVVEKAARSWGSWRLTICCKTNSAEHHFMMRELARQDFVLALSGRTGGPGASGDAAEEHRECGGGRGEPLHKPIGIARANDILQLRRWLMEEETLEKRQPVAGSL